MGLPVINARADLDAITGTPSHAAFMTMLRASLWRLEKDDTLQSWVAIEDNATIERFGFTRADFPDAMPPALPEWVPEPAPQVVSMRQARLALLAIDKLADVDTAIAGMPEPERSAAQIEWEYATSVERQSALITQLGLVLGLDDAAIDQLFFEAAKL